MKTTHTPGLWRINGSQITAQGDMRTLVAVVPSKEDAIPRPDAAAKTFAERDANSRLIASAPALLAALELALATLERVEPAHPHGPFSTVRGSIDAARAAVALARGEDGK